MAYPMQTISVSAATTLVAKNHGETLVVMSGTTGRTITLPTSSGSGAKFTIYYTTTPTSGSNVIAVGNTTDIMVGGLSISTDIAGVTCLATATDDTITMNGSTTGGVKGSVVHVQDVVSGFWLVEGFLVSTGSEATPFSAAV